MSQISRTEQVELRGERHVAHFSPSYHDNNIIKSPVPGPTSTFLIRLPETCALPDRVSLDIGAQNIVTTETLVPVESPDQDKRTYEIQFFREATLLPLHKLFYHVVEVVIRGPKSERYENAEVVIHGGTYGTIENSLTEAPKVGEPLIIQNLGTDRVQINPCFGEQNTLVVSNGCAGLLYHFNDY